MLLALDVRHIVTMPYLLPHSLELGLSPSKLVWGGYFAGFKLLVNGISNNW
jgi:hypothetical protein